MFSAEFGGITAGLGVSDKVQKVKLVKSTPELEEPIYRCSPSRVKNMLQSFRKISDEQKGRFFVQESGRLPYTQGLNYLTQSGTHLDIVR